MTNFLTQHVVPSCVGTGTDGKRVQVVYAYETGTASDYAGKEAVLRNEIANIDDVFALSSAETGGGRRVRWVTDASCVPQIVVAEVPAGVISKSANGAGDWSTLKSALAGQGLNRADRKYLVFGDAPAANPGICGLGDRYSDERPANNYNDYYAAQYGAVYQACFAAFPNNQTSAGHELVHTLGAVQGGSPNASQYGHCTDDGDLMCYPDGSSTPVRQVCPTTHEPLLDCNHDDYFSTSPVPGTYLANSWNVANSSYLDTVATLDSVPSVSLDGPASGTTGQPLSFTASSTGTPTAYQWQVDSVTVTGATGTSFVFTPWYWQTGSRTVTVRATMADGRTAVATKTVTVTAAAAPTVTLAGPTAVADGADFTTTATPAGTGPFTYTWTYPTPYCTPKSATDAASLTLSCALGDANNLSSALTVDVMQADGQAVTGQQSFTVGKAQPTGQLSADITGPTGVLKVGQTYDFSVVAQNTSDFSVSWNDDGAPTTWIEQGYFVSPTTRITPRQAGSATIEAFVYAKDTGQSTTVRLTLQAAGTTTNATAWSGVTASGTNPVTLTAALRDTVTGRPVAGATTTVQGAPYGSSTYTTSGSVVTDANGVATFKATAATAATYRFAFGGSSDLGASTSGTALVKVPTRTALVVKPGYPTTFSGSLANTVTGRALPTGTPVTLKVKWYGTSTWAPVTTLRTDAYGKVAWSWNAYRNGYFQLVYAGSPSTVSSASAAPLVRIPTKATMAVTSGRPDVVSGRLTTGAGASMKYVYVTLQYRTYGTSTWRTVTTQVRTTSTGAMAYKVQPRQRTYYRWVYPGTSTGYLAATSAQGYLTY